MKDNGLIKKFRKYCTYYVEQEYHADVNDHIEAISRYTEGVFNHKFKSNAIKFAKDLMAWHKNDVIKNNVDIKSVPLIQLVKIPNDVKKKIIKTTFELKENLKWKKTVTKIINQ